LLCIATVLSRASGRIGLPVALGFLGVGMVAGSEGPGRIDFEDYGLAMRVGTAALTLILFDGGLHTPLPAFKAAFRPAAVLATAGIGIGLAARALLPRVKLAAAGLYPVLTVSIALIAFSAPTLLRGSGFLAVYLAGVLLGEARLPHHSALLRVHDALAWLAQVGMFLLLGLLVFPSRLLAVAPHGLILALFLAFAPRPHGLPFC